MLFDTIHSCVIYKRHQTERPKPVMADLPGFRVQSHRPLTHVDMDYDGPFAIKEHQPRHAHTIKTYLALFVCMSVKTVHLELIFDLTTGVFLTALNRFIARRGIPSHMYSDCSTNFGSVARQIKVLFSQDKMQDKVTSHIPCAWYFNPPVVPQFGGLWEAAILRSKNHLKRVIDTQMLTYEKLQTLITQIEGILNSRLTPISSDPYDLCALTPGHFLIDQPIPAIPKSDIFEVFANRLTRWRLLRQCHQSFWKR